MRRLQIAPTAIRELRAILRDSRVRFGDEAADRYRSLIEAAFEDLRDRPDRPAARPWPTLGFQTYHIRHSIRRLPADARVARPRHVVVFRYSPAWVEVIRVLHDAMDLPSRLTEN